MSDDATYMKKNGKRVPCCPNHGEPLEGIGFPIPKKGEGMCPISGAHFAFEAESDETTTRKDKFGRIIKDINWNVTGEETC